MHSVWKRESRHRLLSTPGYAFLLSKTLCSSYKHQNRHDGFYSYIIGHWDTATSNLSLIVFSSFLGPKVALSHNQPISTYLYRLWWFAIRELFISTTVSIHSYQRPGFGIICEFSSQLHSDTILHTLPFMYPFSGQRSVVRIKVVDAFTLNLSNS